MAETNGTLNGTAGLSIDQLPRSSVFTSKLPADKLVPTPDESEKTPRSAFSPRQVREAVYTFVRPDNPDESPELLAVSAAALRDLGLKADAQNDQKFRDIVAGKTYYKDTYPWAQCYGGYQFGEWAGQLGDGRAISLFEATNPDTGKRYELQLKGAGRTPYSRFGDGKAVLRSSIREFVVSEALNALGIPSTRALSLTLLPNTNAIRERVEPCAIVCRFAPTWIRLGTFDLPYYRRDRKTTRALADYVIEEVYGGAEKLPKKEGDEKANRYELLYREIVRRNAKTVGYWQAYGFMNGVLNTDNTSILGLSMDFGPFAFMDNFDPWYTPNHDDHALRYSYRNQTTIIWWNLVRLGESLAEFLATSNPDSPEFIENGIFAEAGGEEGKEKFVKRAEEIIEEAGKEYKKVFLDQYTELMRQRLGLTSLDENAFETLLSPLLDLMEAHELDFNNFFRKLAKVPSTASSEDELRQHAEMFLHPESGSPLRVSDSMDKPSSGNAELKARDAARSAVASWLANYVAKVQEDGVSDAERAAAMNGVNPKFVPRGWILQEVIDGVEKKGDGKVLERVMRMALEPFREEWGGEKEEEERWCRDPPRVERAMQCSCSS